MNDPSTMKTMEARAREREAEDIRHDIEIDRFLSGRKVA